MNVFEAELASRGLGELRADRVETVQVNLGLACNLACSHCHLEANEARAEAADWETLSLLLENTAWEPKPHFDITGGSPELNPHLPRVITALGARGNAITLRTNLVLLGKPEYRALVELLVSLKVTLVGSMPCYLEENVNAQRGNGVYAQAIAALKFLNSLGYGTTPELTLDLVYNPGGPGLPPPQGTLEEAYRREMEARHGVSFSNLRTIVNMPLGRFGAALRSSGRLDSYVETLKNAFNPATVDNLMCRSLINVGWDGTLCDCDFNRALGLNLSPGSPVSLAGLTPAALSGRKIVTGAHCLGCTAGQGSSCGGALAV